LGVQRLCQFIERELRISNTLDSTFMFF
jgi:hypothetical protein